MDILVAACNSKLNKRILDRFNVIYTANKKTDQNTSFIVEHTIRQTNKNNLSFLFFFLFFENAKIYPHKMLENVLYKDSIC